MQVCWQPFLTCLRSGLGIGLSAFPNKLYKRMSLIPNKGRIWRVWGGLLWVARRSLHMSGVAFARMIPLAVTA